MYGYKSCSCAADADRYISKQASLIKIFMEINEICENFIASYGEYLTDAEKCYAKQLTWGLRNVHEYTERFFSLVLMNSYRVFDKSHERYPELLKFIKLNDPLWFERVCKNHEDKIRRCKVSVYPLEEALTA